MATLFNVPVKRILVIALLALTGCKDSDKNSSLIFEELNESLERSNKAVKYSTIDALEDLKAKLRVPETAEKTSFWFPKADFIYTKSKEIIDLIDSLKLEIKGEDEKVLQQNSGKLYVKLKNFRESVLTCDPEIKKEFEKKISVFDEGFQARFKNENEFYSVNFNITDLSKRKLVLLKAENDVRNIENMIVIYCKNKIGMVDGPGLYDKFQVIVSSNSSVIKGGEEIIIEAGIGEFKTQAMPTFLIGGKNVAMNENGVGTYKIKVGNKSGKYKIPVKISYYKPDGLRKTYEREIEYTVVEKTICKAAQG